MSVEHQEHGKKVRKVRPAGRSRCPKADWKLAHLQPFTPLSQYLGRSQGSLFLSTLRSKKRKGKLPVIFKKEIYKSLHRSLKRSWNPTFGRWRQNYLGFKTTLAA